MPGFTLQEIPGLLNELPQPLLFNTNVSDTGDGPVKSLGFFDFIRRATRCLIRRNGV